MERISSANARLHDGGLALDHFDVRLRIGDGCRHFTAAEPQEFPKIIVARRTGPFARDVCARELQVRRRRIVQALSELRQAHGQGSHGVAEVVQHSFGKLGESRLKGLINQLSARVRHPLHHAIELLRKPRHLVAAGQIQARRQIRSPPDRHRVARDARERLEHHAIENDHQQYQHGDRRADEVDGGVGDGVMTARRDIARHIDAQIHQRPAVYVLKGAVDPRHIRGFEDLFTGGVAAVLDHRKSRLGPCAEHANLVRRQQAPENHHAHRLSDAAAVQHRCRGDHHHPAIGSDQTPRGLAVRQIPAPREIIGQRLAIREVEIDVLARCQILRRGQHQIAVQIADQQRIHLQLLHCDGSDIGAHEAAVRPLHVVDTRPPSCPNRPRSIPVHPGSYRAHS